MSQNFKGYFEELNFTCQTKINEIKYSKEYLDFRDSLGTSAQTTKKLFTKDLKSNGIYFGQLIKKIAQKKPFTQLLRLK